MQKPKIKHIVCSGGGQTGFSYYGIFRETNKRGVWHIDDIESMYVTSAGSIFGVITALNYDWDVLDDYILKRPWHNVYKIDMYTLIESFTKRGIFDTKVITETFLPLFKGKDISIDVTMKEFYDITHIDLHIFTTEINDFSTVDISHKTHPDWKLVDAVYCSSALPVLFSPFFKDGKCYYDGGILMNYPIQYCFADGALPEEVLGIRKERTVDIEKTDSDKTMFDYIFILIAKVFDKISVHKSRVETFHNEISVVSPETTIEQIQAATSSIEERQKLIDVGVQLANDFIKKHM